MTPATRRRTTRAWLRTFCSFGFVAVAAAGSGCATANESENVVPHEGTVPKVAVTYESRIEAHSAGDSEYSGFYNNFEYKATLLNSAVRDLTLEKQAGYYQWDREKLMSEREKSNQELASQTVVFVSFFTPDRRNDNLTDAKSIWRAYLEVGGRRYEGTVKKVRLLLAELQALYPYHTRWNSPYLISFPVPTTAVETQPSKFTLTGPLGTRAVEFKPIQ